MKLVLDVNSSVVKDFPAFIDALPDGITVAKESNPNGYTPTTGLEEQALTPSQRLFKAWYEWSDVSSRLGRHRIHALLRYQRNVKELVEAMDQLCQHTVRNSIHLTDINCWDVRTVCPIDPNQLNYWYANLTDLADLTSFLSTLEEVEYKAILHMLAWEPRIGSDIWATLQSAFETKSEMIEITHGAALLEELLGRWNSTYQKHEAYVNQFAGAPYDGATTGYRAEDLMQYWCLKHNSEPVAADSHE